MKTRIIVRRRGSVEKVVKEVRYTGKVSGSLARIPIGTTVQQASEALGINCIDAQKKRQRKRYRPAKQGGVVLAKDKGSPKDCPTFGTPHRLGRNTNHG